jgi:hypothetical protein
MDTGLVLHRSLHERGWQNRLVHRRTADVLNRVEHHLSDTYEMVEANGGNVTRVRE